LILLMTHESSPVDSPLENCFDSITPDAVARTSQFDHYLQRHFTAGRALLVLAIAAGLVLRFYRLDTASITADEGAAWAAAIEPVTRLLELQSQLDAGKLALYDLLLHCWIWIFGDGLRSIRGLSGAIGSISILLSFEVLRELYQVFADEDWKTGELAGGFAALLFATNVSMVGSARTARMYPLMTAAELAQILFFVRGQHRRQLLNYSLAALALAIAIAANFTAMFLVVGESLWLGYLLLAEWRQWSEIRLPILVATLSLAAGLGILLPFAPGALAVSRSALGGGALGWVHYQPPLAWSYHLLRDATGNKTLFRLLVVLVAFAFWRHWNKAQEVSAFMAAVVIGPFLTVAILSWFGRPMMVDRYVLLAVIGFLGLAAIGAAAFSSKLGRVTVFLLIVWLSVRALRHRSGFWIDWREAAAITCAESTGDAEIGVVPAYAVNAVRYHLPVERRRLAFGLNSRCGDAQILIVGRDGSIRMRYISELNACYPRLLGRATRVEVRGR
jgi:mannosyltransferase